MRKRFYAAVLYEIEVDGTPPTADEALVVLRQLLPSTTAPALVEGGRLVLGEGGVIPKMDYQRLRFLARLGRASNESASE